MNHTRSSTCWRAGCGESRTPGSGRGRTETDPQPGVPRRAAYFTPTLHEKLKNLPWADVPATRQVTKGRGQRVTRTIKVVAVPDWITFPGAAQVAQLRRTVTKAGRKRIEVVYLITSADHKVAPPATLTAWVQGHWGVENRLHWVSSPGQAPRVMATFRNVAISMLRIAGWDNIAAGLRHHAADPARALALALT